MPRYLNLKPTQVIDTMPDLNVGLQYQLAKEKQERSDTASAMYSQTMANILSQPTYDPKARKEVMDKVEADLDEILKKNNGSYAQSFRDIQGLIGSVQADPYFDLNRFALEQQKVRQAYHLQAGDDALVFKGMPTGIYDEKGNRRNREDFMFKPGDIEKRKDYVGTQSKLVDNALKDEKFFEGIDKTNYAAFLRGETSTSISQKQVDAKVDSLFNQYSATTEYDQQKRAIEAGLIAEGRDEDVSADEIIKEQIRSIAESRMYESISGQILNAPVDVDTAARKAANKKRVDDAAKKVEKYDVDYRQTDVKNTFNLEDMRSRITNAKKATAEVGNSMNKDLSMLAIGYDGFNPETQYTAESLFTDKEKYAEFRNGLETDAQKKSLDRMYNNYQKVYAEQLNAELALDDIYSAANINTKTNDSVTVSNLKDLAKELRAGHQKYVDNSNNPAHYGSMSSEKLLSLGRYDDARIAVINFIDDAIKDNDASDVAESLIKDKDFYSNIVSEFGKEGKMVYEQMTGVIEDVFSTEISNMEDKSKNYSRTYTTLVPSKGSPVEASVENFSDKLLRGDIVGASVVGKGVEGIKAFKELMESVTTQRENGYEVTTSATPVIDTGTGDMKFVVSVSSNSPGQPAEASRYIVNVPKNEVGEIYSRMKTDVRRSAMNAIHEYSLLGNPNKADEARQDTYNYAMMELMGTETASGTMNEIFEKAGVSTMKNGSERSLNMDRLGAVDGIKFAKDENGQYTIQFRLAGQNDYTTLTKNDLQTEATSTSPTELLGELYMTGLLGGEDFDQIPFLSDAKQLFNVLDIRSHQATDESGK